MKNWHKILCFVLVMVMIFSLTACTIEHDTQNNVASTQNGTTTNGTTEQNTSVNNTQNSTNDVIFENTTRYDAVVDDVSMESITDNFTVLDKAYNADEKFVYTSIVYFESGVAAGLAFGAQDGSYYWVFIRFLVKSNA